MQPGLTMTDLGELRGERLV